MSKGQQTWKAGVVLVLVLLVAGVVMNRDRPQASPDEMARSTPARAPAASALPRLLDLGSEKCMACKAMIPVLADLRQTCRDKLTVDFIDVWKDREAAKRYKIDMIPTQIFFDAQGRELFRHTGFYSKNDILAKFRGLGVKL